MTMDNPILQNLSLPAVDAVILGNGDYPSHPLPLHILSEAPFVVCCDGGANEYIRQGNLPNLIVGDGDSLLPHYRTTYAHLLHHVSDQETNDQTKAVRHLLSLGKRNLLLVGATGKREDHTLGNISLLTEYQQLGANVAMLTDYGIFFPCRGNHTFFCTPRAQVSIFNLDAHTLSAIGLKYPLYTFHAWWQGTLNESLSSTFSIQSYGTYLVFVTYEGKDVPKL